MNHNPGTFVFGGQARLPKEISAIEVFQVIAHVEVATGKVVEVDFMPCPTLITGMLRQMMVGMSLQSDVGDLLVQIEQRLYHKSKKAVITAIKDLVREYREFLYRASKASQPS